MNKTLVAFTLILATAFAAFSDITLTSTYSMTEAVGNIVNGPVASDGFGTKVSNAGRFTQTNYDDFVVGTAKGKAYIIRGQSSARTAAMDLLVASATNFITISTPHTALITQVACAGKFTSTTRDSIILSFPSYDIPAGNADVGKVYVIFPRETDYDFSSTAWANSATTGVEIVKGTPAANDFLGTAISTVGDVVGTTFDDIVVTIPGKFAYVIAGIGSTAPSAAIDPTAGIVITPLAADTDFGTYAAGDFDFNGDQRDDFVIGAPATDKVYVIYAQGTAAAFTAIDFTAGTPPVDRYTSITVTGAGNTGAKFGYNVAVAGDINNDGADDLIIGAPEHSRSGTNKEGRAYVIFGVDTATTALKVTDIANAASVTPSATPKGFIITGNTVGAELGFESDGVGDINADGYDDFIVSAPYASGSRASASGKVYVVYGRSTANTYDIDFSAATGNTAFASTVGFSITGESGAEFGASVSAVGDVTGDGAPDFVVGAPNGETRGLAASATARVKPGVVYQFNGQVKTPSGSGFRLEASLLVIVSFFAALMF